MTQIVAALGTRPGTLQAMLIVGSAMPGHSPGGEILQGTNGLLVGDMEEDVGQLGGFVANCSGVPARLQGAVFLYIVCFTRWWLESCVVLQRGAIYIYNRHIQTLYVVS